ncbi:MAG: hypothetical protein WC783_05580 [Candidatus Paceibacterota bacterium]|jgi:hypothetical protein
MNNQKILISIVVLVILAGLMLWAYQSQNNISDNQSLTITNFEECKQAGYPIMESYPEQCRTTSGELFVQVIENPNSETNPPTRIAAGYVAGHVTIGPNCPGPEKIGQPCPIPPGAYSSREVVVYDSDKVSVNVKGKIDSEGNYKIALGPGNYFVQIVPAGIKAGEKMPVTIKSFETSTVNFNIDTGIR